MAGLLGGNRLVTITGAGGAGKTRLALQAAAEVVEPYPDRIWLGGLADVTDAEIIAATVAAAIGVKADVGGGKIFSCPPPRAVLANRRGRSRPGRRVSGGTDDCHRSRRRDE